MLLLKAYILLFLSANLIFISGFVFKKFFLKDAEKNILITGILGAFLFLIIGVFVLSFFSSSAVVNIALDSKSEEKKSQIVFSESDSTDIKNNIIQGEIISIEEEGSATINAGRVSLMIAGVPFSSLMETQFLSVGT